MRIGGLFLLVLLVVLLASSAAQAQTDIRFRGIGGTIGIYDPNNWDTAVGIGAFADLGTLARNVGLEANIDWWSKSQDRAFFLGSYKWTVRDIAFGGTVKYFFSELSPSIIPYAGGGLALHFVKAKLKDTTYLGNDIVAAEASDTKIGLDLVGGGLLGKSDKLRFLAEVRYRIVSDWDQFVLRGGVVYYLPK